MNYPYDLALAIDELMPAARYRGSLTANTKAAFDRLNWDKETRRPLPTWEEVHAKALEIKTRVNNSSIGGS